MDWKERGKDGCHLALDNMLMREMKKLFTANLLFARSNTLKPFDVEPCAGHSWNILMRIPISIVGVCLGSGPKSK